MITDSASVEELVIKFKILEKYPKTAEGELALMEALSAADTKVQAEQFVNGWIRGNKRCPMPCDIYQALDTPGRRHAGRYSVHYGGFPAIPAGAPIPAAEYHCDQCQDSGWFIVPTKKAIPDRPGQFYTAAKRCPHPPDRRGTLSK